jgi:hypothetical protein
MKIPHPETLLRALYDDLRSRRLLPVVGALIVALVAIPLLLSDGGGTPAAHPLASTGSSAGGVGGVPGITVTTTPNGSKLPRHGHDPFIQQVRARATAVAASASASRAAASTAAAAASAASSTPATPAPATASPPTPVATTTPSQHPATPPTSAPKPLYVTYSAKLRFGTAGTKLRTYDHLDRFAPLPSLRKLMVVYLGVERDGRTAVFLVSSEVAPGGEGSCRPSRTRCIYLYMKPGQKEIFLSTLPSGDVRETVLRYVRVEIHRSTKLPATKVSRDGRRVVHWVGHRLLPSLARLRYARRTGLISSTLSTRGPATAADARAAAPSGLKRLPLR